MIVLRNSSVQFKSIENVFLTLIPYLKVESITLPFESKGLLNRIKNIMFVISRFKRFIHITGHDHYLIWWPIKRSILTIHDIEAFRRKTGIKKWLFKKLWFDIPIRNATEVTTISEFSKNEILSLGKYKTNISVIYNPLTLPIEYIPKKINKDLPRILHIGVKKNKNLLRLVRSLKGLECILIIIGEIDDETKSELLKYRVQYQIKSNISNSSMIEEYYLCDVLAFVSTYEGFGLPIIEAQAAGRAVITSNISSMPEIAGEGAILVDPFSETDIRNGIVELIKNDSLREKIIMEGLNNVSRFTPELIAKKYEELYLRVSNGK